MKQHDYVIPFIVALSLFIHGCDSRSEKTTENRANANDGETTKFVEMLARPSQEKVALLSMKYKLDPKIVESILDEYLSKVDMTYSMMKSVAKRNDVRAQNDANELNEMMTRDNDSFVEIVQQLSRSHSIDATALSSLLIDYREWTAAEESQTSE